MIYRGDFMKKQTIHNSIMGILTLLSGYLYALASSEPTTAKIFIKELPKLNHMVEEKNALKYLNDLRIGAGLIPLKFNETLNKATKNHAHYLIENHTIGHKEDFSLTGYSGEFASNRSINVGYHTPLLIENVSSNNHSYKESIDGLMAAIYHRFSFLDFRIDEIGIGVNQNKQNREQTAYVYNLGNSQLNKLCKYAPINTSKNSNQSICANRYLKVEKQKFYNALNFNDKQNTPIVLYPFNKQQGVSPVFYEELPDPLPNYGVSGFPISIAFSETKFDKIEVQSFKLFNQKYEEIKESIYFTQKSDPNKMLKKFEFVLFPLKRLMWNHQYHVEVLYLENGTEKKKQWTFKTKKFTQPFHEVEVNKSYSIKKDEENIFYFPPLSKNDILGNLTYPAYLDISFIDKNTIKLVATKVRTKPLVLSLGKHSLKLLIKK